MAHPTRKYHNLICQEIKGKATINPSLNQALQTSQIDLYEFIYCTANKMTSLTRPLSPLKDLSLLTSMM